MHHVTSDEISSPRVAVVVTVDPVVARLGLDDETYLASDRSWA